jgi:Flp pilus assembly protein TadG
MMDDSVDDVATDSGPAKQPGWSRIKNDESGLALVWMSLFLMVLLGFAALAVDIGHGYLVAQRAQNAADAAALAGTIYLPGDAPTAYSTAYAVATANGFTSDPSGNEPVTVTAEQQKQPTQLKVTVTETIRTWFARALGFNDMTITRSAIADYDQPVAMGSPANTFGNQPDCSGTCSTGNPKPDFWANVAGKLSDKVSGDRFQADTCTSNVDNCPTSGTNTEYHPNGYVYAINVDNGSSGPLEVDMFDPAFVNVGDHCDNSNDPGAPGAASNLLALYTATGDARFQPGDASQYCTGDQYFPNPGTSGTPAAIHAPWTSYRLFYPDDTPWTLADNTPVPGCAADFQPFVGDLSTSYPSGPDSAYLQQVFRKWVPLCTVPAAQTGAYLLQVRTNVSSDGVTPLPDGAGHNRFAIRAMLNNNLANTGVSIYAQANMAIYANATGASTNFYLARVLPGAAGRTLDVTFYDIGDAAGTATLTVLPPADAQMPGASAGSLVPMTQFTGCKYTPPTGDSGTGPPFGTFTDTDPNCSVTDSTPSDWNGQAVQWEIPIPAGYSCTFSDLTKCWATLEVSYAAGTSVQDTTTWEASLGGDPVRIVK